MTSRGRLALGLLFFATACGADEPTGAPEPATAATRPEPDEPDEPDPEAPAPVDAPWAEQPAGFEPVELPPTADGCDGSALFIGTSETHAVGAAEPHGIAARWAAIPEGQRLSGVAGEVQRFLRPIGVLAAMVGSYNGPGGEPYARWQLEDDPPILLFDRRVSRARFDAALRGARGDMHRPVRVGGVDANGERRCAIAWLDMGSPGIYEAPAWAATIASDGDLLVESTGHTRRDPARIARGSAPAALGGEESFHAIVIRRGDAAPAAVLHALALARFEARRYGALRDD